LDKKKKKKKLLPKHWSIIDM